MSAKAVSSVGSEGSGFPESGAVMTASRTLFVGGVLFLNLRGGHASGQNSFSRTLRICELFHEHV